MTTADHLSAEDRMWNVRDAILLWLYQEKIAGNRMPRYDLSRLGQAVGWVADPITSEDWVQATRYLVDEDYISGTVGFGSGVARPSITSKGENMAAAKKSVRPGATQPANTTGVTNNITFNNHGPSQNAVNSSDFDQSMSFEAQKDKAIAVAGALEAYAAEEHDNSSEASELANEIREAADNAESTPGPLRALFGRAVAIGAAAFGTEVGRQVSDTAMQGLQALTQ